MENKEFDLNIEKILENWEVFHAVREIIANAIDEQILTRTEEISIFKDELGQWHIVDYGRGLNYHHLTQNENEEKLRSDKLIGRFGVGLKDALATLYRHNIKVRISSKFGVITLKQTKKVGFDDIITLHADIAEPDDRYMVGTDVCLNGCDDESIKKAKSLFLKFSNTKILEITDYGSVIAKEDDIADIYINGVKVAEEPNFLFSYNITSLTTKLKKALNRERTNVGRSAYTDRIKAILLHCEHGDVINDLMTDLQSYATGNAHDELSWQEVQMYASDQMRKLQQNVTFVTADDLKNYRSVIDKMERGGYTPIVIPDTLAIKMADHNSYTGDGEHFTTTSQFVKNENADFKPVIVNENDLTADERLIYSKTGYILNAIGGRPSEVKVIEIVEKLYDVGYGIGGSTIGLWESHHGRILIKRSELRSLSAYAGVLIHECAHAMSGADDVSREFESVLTDIIGNVVSQLITKP